MAHRSSAAALHAARVILENFDLEVIPPEDLPSGRVAGLTASAAHLSIVIDLMTNAFEVAALRPELRYWQKRIFADTATAPQITAFFMRCLEAFEKVPRGGEEQVASLRPPDTFFGERLPDTFSRKAEQFTVSRAAQEGTRGIFHYYRVSAKNGEKDEQVNKFHVTTLLEASIGMQKAEPGRELLQRWKAELLAGRATVTDIKKCLRAFGILLAQLPSYGEPDEESKLLV